MMMFNVINRNQKRCGLNDSGTAKLNGNKKTLIFLDPPESSGSS
jgi:hypothetical protein